MGMSYNEFLVIGIPEVLTNLIPCRGFVKDKNSTVVLSFLTRLVEYYLSIRLFIIEHNSKNLSSVPN